jgi:HipA-like protein
MREAQVFRNNILAGTLTEESRTSYVFRYEPSYLNDSTKPAISLTLPKSKASYSSPFLFPFFFNMLSEGANKKLQCMYYHIDEADSFGLLLATGQWDTIGAVTIKPIE